MKIITLIIFLFSLESFSQVNFSHLTGIGYLNTYQENLRTKSVMSYGTTCKFKISRLKDRQESIEVLINCNDGYVWEFNIIDLFLENGVIYSKNAKIGQFTVNKSEFDLDSFSLATHPVLAQNDQCEISKVGENSALLKKNVQLQITKTEGSNFEIELSIVEDAIRPFFNEKNKKTKCPFFKEFEPVIEKKYFKASLTQPIMR